MLRRRFLVALGLTPLVAGAAAAVAHDAAREDSGPDMVEVEYIPVRLVPTGDPPLLRQRARRLVYPVREVRTVHRYRLMLPADYSEPATIAATILYEGPNSPRLAHWAGHIQRI